MYRKTKIVCTIGPATESEEMMEKLIDSGMNVMRLNLSHGNYEEHKRRILTLRGILSKTANSVAILLDTKGPEIRLGDFKNKEEEYKKGEMVTIVREKIIGTHEQFHIQCHQMFDDVNVGGTILIDDGKCRLTVLEKKSGELMCRIENDHILQSRKGCNLPGVNLTMPFLSDQDEEDIRFGCKMKVDYIALSFTRRKEDVLQVREILNDEGMSQIQLIPKIENQEGLDHLSEILEVSDGVMVARGDLGVDTSFEYVPTYQKQIVKSANAIGKPVIIATHMLESMQSNPRPTRAEASDVANAILDGTDAIMLSVESAIGLYPVESVQVMDKIAKVMEPILPYREHLKTSVKTGQRTKNDAIGIAVADIVLTLDVRAIIAFTQSGTTARRISKFRSKVPIIAVTFHEEIQRSLAMHWGVHAVLSEVENNQNNESDLARALASDMGFCLGDIILVVAGYPTGVGATNAIKIIEI